MSAINKNSLRLQKHLVVVFNFSFVAYGLECFTKQLCAVFPTFSKTDFDFCLNTLLQTIMVTASSYFQHGCLCVTQDCSYQTSNSTVNHLTNVVIIFETRPIVASDYAFFAILRLILCLIWCHKIHNHDLLQTITKSFLCLNQPNLDHSSNNLNDAVVTLSG